MNSEGHPARQWNRKASTLAVLLLALVIAACETPGGGAFGGSAEARAERLALNGEYAEAASAYIGLAAGASGGERDRLTLLAVDNWLDAGDAVRAQNAFRGVAQPQSGELLWRWNSTRAAMLLFRGDADSARDILESLSRESLPPALRLRVEALRADAWFQLQEPARAIELLVQRETWLDDRQSIERNRERIWKGLLVSDPHVLRAAAEMATDPTVRGWLTLGSLATATGQQGIGWSNGVVRWRERNTGHPAMSVLDDLDISTDQLLAYPRRIALLLPLSGRAASAGLAVQNGFLGAYFASAGGLDDRQSVRIYDVDAEGGPSAAYMSAVEDGAEFVVGPLLRNNVNELANDILVPVPVLTLNYLPDESLPPPGLFQFALAPEDEAISAATRALQDGHRTAVALVPNSNWGRRLLTAFATEFEARGGALLDYRSFTSESADFSRTIEELMGLAGSVSRYQRMRANIGSPLQFDPRRRQDVDFIFLAADGAAGRLLKSQLKFHYSGDLPVYSTSSIYAMDGRSNSDLNGIRFADTPWIIAPQSWIRYLPDVYREYWPEERRLGRLHAMGYDAYHLVAPLFAARNGTMPEIDGATGVLFLDSNGRVHRRLAWAEFRRGEPVPLPGPGDLDSPSLTIGGDEAVSPDSPDDDQTWYEETREL
ncbi:MAG TPA: penicillin-binding protein activator [Woeseiaceae bacterium]|nr:penicillin-binding protein activator [Woeseiaceae bacterium]